MFEDFCFKEYINKGLASIGFREPTPIQKLVIPKALLGVNIIGTSPTGTGKTHAFLLPLLQKLDESLAFVQAVIIVPTRELGMQILSEIRKIIVYSPQPIDVRLYVGGTDRKAELQRLERKQPQIVIGTIGKLTDLVISEHALRIDRAKYVVIDEADMVFDPAETIAIDHLFSRFHIIQVLSFSATVSQNLIVFLNRYVSGNEVIDLRQKEKDKRIEHLFLPVLNGDRDRVLTELLTVVKPYSALIFTNTVTKAEEIALMLNEKGFKCAVLTGKMRPRERKQTIKRIKDGIYRYVAASDIVARGTDIPEISHIINYELPFDPEYYIHRTGRTARYDKKGTAITLFTPEEEKKLLKIKTKGIEIALVKIKDGKLIHVPSFRKKVKETAFASAALRKYPLADKVKPGYKKKRKEIIEKEIKKEKKSRIKAFYRKSSSKKTS